MTAPATRRLLVCDWRASNRYVIARLARQLHRTSVETTDVHGVPGDCVEAMALARLAGDTL